MKPTIKHRLEYAFVRALMFGLGYLPEVLAYGGISALGQLFFLCSKRRQEYALRFLRQAYPDGKTDRELLAIGRRSTGNFLKVSMDMVRVHRVLRRGDISRYVEGFDTIAEQLPAGPALLVTGHLGSWEVGAVSVARATRESHCIARVFKNPLLQRFIENSRGTAGLHMHSRRGGIRGLARALRRGVYAMQVIDQNQRLRGLFVPFFGRIASTERGAATLAVRQGYPVVMINCVRVGPGFRFRLEVRDVIQTQVSADREGMNAEVVRVVRRLNSCLEGAILETPEQYLWIHDRYRTQPDDTAVDAVEVQALPAGERA